MMISLYMNIQFDIQKRFNFDYKQGQEIEFMLPDLITSDTGIVRLHRSNYVELEDCRIINKGLIYKVKTQESYDSNKCPLTRKNRANTERISC